MEWNDKFNKEITDYLSSTDEATRDIIRRFFNNKHLHVNYANKLKNKANTMGPSYAISFLVWTADEYFGNNNKIKGIDGLAQLLNVSKKTAQKLKNSGKIDHAIVPPSDLEFSKSKKLYFYEREILLMCVPKHLKMQSFKFRSEN